MNRVYPWDFLYYRIRVSKALQYEKSYKEWKLFPKNVDNDKLNSLLE